MSKNQYNPWENKNTFIQNVGNTESVLDIISSEGIDLIPSMPDFKNINNIKDENNNDEIINSNSIDNKQTSILP